MKIWIILRKYFPILPKGAEYYSYTMKLLRIKSEWLQLCFHFVHNIFVQQCISCHYRTCKPLEEGSIDIQNFAQYVAGNFFGVIQYNKDNREFEVNPIFKNVQIQPYRSLGNVRNFFRIDKEKQKSEICSMNCWN